MEIKPNLTASTSAGSLSTTPRAAQKQSVANSEMAVFQQVDSLDSLLGNESSVRGEAVQRARELIAQPDWPTREVNLGVASLLANHIDRSLE